MKETTLVLIKPEGQGLLAEITSRLVTQSGLKLVAVKTVLDNGIQQKWNEVNFKVDRIESGPVTALVFEGHNAVEITRQALADIGVKKVHRSETKEQAQREIDLWFIPEEMARPNSEPEKTQSKNNPDQKARTVEGWHDLFIKCPHISDQIFSQMNLEEILQLCEVCEDWGQAVQNSKMVQDRLSDVKLHKAAVEGWLRVAKLLLDRGADPNQRIVCDGLCIKFTQEKHYNRDIRNMALSWTPLHGAVVMRRPEMTKLLRSRGAKSKGVDSELRFYNYEEPGNPCIHIVTPIQLSSSFWNMRMSSLIRAHENENDRHLVHDVLLGRRTESNYYSPSTPHSLQYCLRCR